MTLELVLSGAILLLAVQAARVGRGLHGVALAAGAGIAASHALLAEAAGAALYARAAVLGVTTAALVLVWPALALRAGRELLAAALLAACFAALALVAGGGGPLAPERARIAAAGLLALALAEPATCVVRGAVSILGRDTARGPGRPEGEGLPRAGELIGVLERWILFALAALGEYPAIGFVLAAKAIARHREFERPAFAEYFLVGTLTSALLALLAGMAL